MSARVLYLKGMHGMGDNFHQRNFIRQALEMYDVVYLETSWPSIYWDLVESGKLKLLFKNSALRTQEKNAARENHLFYKGPVPLVGKRTEKQIWYRAHHVRQLGSVLGAMGECLQMPVGDADFRFPIKDEWQQQFEREILQGFKTDGKPILVYRPLVERTEWTGCNARNPDHDAYRTLYRSIRERFYVVSVADIQPGKEWIVGASESEEISDIAFHKGELTTEMLTTLVKNAAMTFNSPGFMTIMSQAVGTPNVTVFGGYESSASFSAGTKWASCLSIDPIHPCQCFLHAHACDKTIDIPDALARLKRFTDAVTSSVSTNTTPSAVAATDSEVAA